MAPDLDPTTVAATVVTEEERAVSCDAHPNVGRDLRQRMAELLGCEPDDLQR